VAVPENFTAMFSFWRWLSNKALVIDSKGLVSDSKALEALVIDSKALVIHVSCSVTSIGNYVQIFVGAPWNCGRLTMCTFSPRHVTASTILDEASILKYSPHAASFPSPNGQQEIVQVSSQSQK
jgi:hypothetical protein